MGVVLGMARGHDSSTFYQDTVSSLQRKESACKMTLSSR